MSSRRLIGLIWEGVLLELALYRCLSRWVARRPDVPAGASAIGYARLVTPVLWLWIFGSATEVVVVEVVLRSIDASWADAIRLPLLVLGVWGLAWMLGMVAANQVRPHLLDADRIRVRSGPRTWADVPLAHLDAVKGVEHDLPGVVKTLHHEGDLLLVGVSRRTNLELSLAEPTRVATSKGEVDVQHVGLWVDEPRTVARQLHLAPHRSA